MKEFQKFGLIAFCAFLMTLQSCFNDTDNELTIVKGTVTNKITGEKLQDIPLEILKCANALNIGGPRCDSLKTVYTDAEGMYETSFLTDKGYHYKIGIGNNKWYESTVTMWDGEIIKEGKTNALDFRPIPFKILQVDLEINKSSKNFIHVEYSTIDSKGSWLGGTVLLDTAVRNQLIDTTLFLKIFPLRNYRVSKQICVRTGLEIQNYVYSACDLNYLPDLYIEYNDTTKITVN